MAGLLNQLKKLSMKLKRKRADTEKAHVAGMLRMGLYLQRKSQEIVPIDTATLKRSARTTQEGEGFAVEVSVSYGTEYAIFVHENLQAAHATGKQAKFLEQPARTEQKAMMQIYKDTLAKFKKR